MTFNEAKAALAIGCKVRLPGWEDVLYTFKMDEYFIHYIHKDRGDKISRTPSSYLARIDWEIYHENQGSNTSPKDRV